jgi:hypothetical protein
MSGRRTDSPVMAQRQAKLMSSVIYDGSVLGQAQNSLEGFSLSSFDPPPPHLALPRPIPGSMLLDYPGRILSSELFLRPHADLWAPRVQGYFPRHKPN